MGKCFSSVMPEKCTKSIPASLAISANRNGLDSVCLDMTIVLGMLCIRSPSMWEAGLFRRVSLLRRLAGSGAARSVACRNRRLVLAS